MLTENRRKQILEMVNQTASESLRVNELAKHFGVSGMTIRRDLEYLEQLNLLHRVHGGAVSRFEGLTAPPFTERRKESSRVKTVIGLLAAQCIQEGDQVILDSGTTTLQIARRLSGFNDLTIVTNSLSISSVLARMAKARVIVLGGELRQEEECTVGPVPAQQVSQYSVDKAFIGAAGFSITKGATDVHFPEIQVKQAMISAAREVILVADSSKWQVECLIRIAGIEVFSKIITDDGIPQAAMEALERQNIQVITPKIAAARYPMTKESL